MLVIEDELHAEHQGRFQTRQQALAELQPLAAIRWNEAPNHPPCGKRHCGRRYELIESDDSATPRAELSRTLPLEILLRACSGFRT
ncbi:hypothetical protein CO669_24680 [Bradyrhizobium sp. Y36]|uniref:hypothetical protein n=1 Tax=Bradyrhizobium sp. Y36 TaxID=2035447 RepID=UPI000BEA927F|nr:hypothetical protein [Bradyrhizobium sp. Y36]PDT87712.1 hypothetical protein CO669_24680 [Bradyrhizobium sp. Y36]